MCCSSAKVIWFMVKFLTREWGVGREGRGGEREEGRQKRGEKEGERGVQGREKKSRM